MKSKDEKSLTLDYASYILALAIRAGKPPMPAFRLCPDKESSYD